MQPNRFIRLNLGLALILCSLVGARIAFAQYSETPPVNFTIAFFGDFVLEQNYPNPFGSEGNLPAPGGSSVTAIRFRLAKPAQAKLTIINLLGEQVRSLANGDMPDGWHHIQWDGRDDLGRRVPSGIYLYRFESDHQIVTRKLLILR